VSRFARRLLGAARLQADAYEEVEADPRALAQAACVVALAALSSGAGTGALALRAGLSPRAVGFQVGVSLLLVALLWLGGSAFAYMTGASFFRGPETRTDFAEVLRTTGFAFGPGWLLCLMVLPPAWLGIALAWAVRAWLLAAGVVALRQALDFTTARALGTFGSAALLLWLVVWGLAVVPVPF
jgi:hypothetical protein